MWSLTSYITNDKPFLTFPHCPTHPQEKWGSVAVRCAWKFLKSLLGQNCKGLKSFSFTFLRLLKSFLDPSFSSCSKALLANTYICMAHQIPNPVTSQDKLCSQTYWREVWMEPNDIVFSLWNSLHFSETLLCSLERLSQGGEFWTLTWRRKAFSKSRMALGYFSFRKNWAHPPLYFHCIVQILPL